MINKQVCVQTRASARAHTHTHRKRVGGKQTDSQTQTERQNMYVRICVCVCVWWDALCVRACVSMHVCVRVRNRERDMYGQLFNMTNKWSTCTATSIILGDEKLNASCFYVAHATKVQRVRSSALSHIC